MLKEAVGYEQGTELVGLREALRNQRRIVATFLMLPRVEIVEMLGAAGFDAVIFDLEHAPIDVSHLPSLAAAARGCGMFGIARLASAAEADIAKALDTGVDGILIPHVESPTAAARIVAAGRFPPEGERSLNPYVRGTNYGWGEGRGRLEANRRVALLIMLEGDDAIAAMDEICVVDGLDAVFVGPVDLSASLGVPGEAEHPIVVRRVAEVFDRVGRSGLAAGVYAPTPEAATRWFEAGASLVAVSADIAMAVESFAETRARVRAVASSAALASHD